MDTTLQQRKLFQARIIAFLKDRPREWIKLVDFRSNRVEAHTGYIEYVLILQHREKWQNLGAILSSRGQVYNYAVELQKELDTKYQEPHAPVDFRNTNRDASSARKRSVSVNVGPNGLDDSNCHLSFVDELKQEK